MAAKGTESKTLIFSKLKEIFPDAFWEEDGKILRIPLDENGSRIEIKVTLTAAKNLLGDNTVNNIIDIQKSKETNEIKSIEPTKEEKENVAKLIASLGL